MSILICFLTLVFLSSLKINFHNFIIIFGYAHFFLTLAFKPNLKKMVLGVLSIVLGLYLYHSDMDYTTMMNTTLILFVVHTLLDETCTSEKKDYFRMIIILYIGLAVYLKVNDIWFDSILLNTRKQVEISSLILFHYLRWYLPKNRPKFFYSSVIIVNSFFLIGAILLHGNILNVENNLDIRWFWSWTITHILLSINFQKRNFESISHFFNKFSPKDLVLRAQLSRK